MQTPKVSVVIPTYNRAQCIGEAIHSVLAQTYQNYEVIVIDDGSTDPTPSVLGAFGGRIHVLSQANQGVSAARNAGIQAARGEWIAFLDSDDLWNPAKLEIQMRDVAQRPAVVAHLVDAVMIGYPQGDLSLFEVRGCAETYRREPFRPRPLVDVLRVQFFTPSWLLKRSAVERAGLFHCGFRIFEDFELLTRIALQGAFWVNPFKGVLVRRLGSASQALSHQFGSRPQVALTNLCAIYDSLLDRDALDLPERREVRRRVSGARFELFTLLKQSGRAFEARRLLWRSVVDCPGVRSLVRAAMGLAGGSKLVDTLKDATRKPESLFRRSAVDSSPQAPPQPGGSLPGGGREKHVVNSDPGHPGPHRPRGA